MQASFGSIGRSTLPEQETPKKKPKSSFVTGLLCGMALVAVPIYGMEESKVSHMWSLSMIGGCAHHDVDGNLYWDPRVK